MANCPVCNAPVPDDFGLIECGECHAPLLVHMDGRVEHSGTSEPAPAGMDEPLDEDPKTHFAFEGNGTVVKKAEPTQSKVRLLERTSEHKPQPEPEPEPYDDHTVPSAASPVFDDFAAEAHVEPEAEGPADRTQLLPSEPANDFLNELGFSPEPEPEPEPVIEPEPPGLGDIARFGNSDNAAREGSLRYTLIVTGIDTIDVRSEFREALTDRKLMWDTDAILRSLKQGEVRIPNVSAAKAFVLVTRLKSLPVQVRWEQYAVSQS